MQISDILSPDRVVCDVASQSKKAVLEAVSNLVAATEPGVTQAEIFDSLVARERLGSTGIGHGIALPHGRLKHGNRTLGAFIKLRSAIDYDAVDQLPVDLLFALLVPAESTEEHLQVLSLLAERFSHDEILKQLRQETSTERIFELLTN